MDVLLVDDHRIVLDGLKAMLLGSEYRILAALQSGKALRNWFASTPDLLPELILMDIRIPDESGLSLCKWVHESYPDIRLVFLSANLDAHTLTEGIRAGAQGFLPKDSSEAELLTALRTVGSGHPYFGEEIREQALQSYMQHIQHPEQSKKGVTEREREVIRLFAEGLTYKEIAERLHISRRTVESHKESLLRKLDLKTVMDLVKYGIREGFVEL